jgi:hypothetical protein
MSRLYERENGSSHEEWIWPCDCHDTHYLRATWDEDPAWRYLWIESVAWPQRWRDRFAEAWRCLRGRRCSHNEVVLGTNTIADLKQFVDRHDLPLGP